MRISIAVHFVVYAALSASLSGCKKADPEPEKRDAIFQSYNETAAKGEGEIKAAEAAVAEALADVKAATPQTGQIKYAEKRYWEAKNKLDMTRQRVHAAKVQAEMRMWKTRTRSLEAFHKGDEISFKEDIEAANLQAELDRWPRSWNPKKRRAELGLSVSGRNPAASGDATSGGAGEKKPAAGGQH